MVTTHYHLDKISFQGGIRYDTRLLKTEEVGILGEQDYIAAIDKDFNSFNAAFGLKIDLLENLYARINLASGFRAPNLAELASNGVHEGTNRYEIGNSDLNNEQNFQIDTSLEFKNEHFEVFANVFYNNINQYIFIQPTDQIIEDNIVYIYTQDNAKLYGGEFGLHFHPHPLDWLHLSSSFETVTGKQLNGDFLPLQPANSLSNTLKIEFDTLGVFQKPFFSTTYKNTFKQNNISDFETPTDGYNLLNMTIGTEIKILKIDTRIGIQAINITDEAYVSHLSRLKIDGIENIGRSVNFSLQLQL
jgi:iron complex outermembrane receptor protein